MATIDTNSRASTATAADVLWGRRREPTRGPKASLTVDAIAEVAVAIADADGVDAVSMQRVAERLGCTKMALYRHLPSKDALLAVMIDRAVGTPPELGPGDWRAKLLTYVERLWAVWEAHPWVPAVTVGSRVMGPNETGWVERAVGALAGTGLAGTHKIDAVLLLSAHIRTAHSRSTTGSYPWDATRSLADPMAEILRDRADEFPEILAVVDDRPTLPAHDPTAGIGLRCVLLGIERLIQERAGSGGVA